MSQAMPHRLGQSVARHHVLACGLVAAAAAVTLSAAAQADPLPNEVLKFSQLPLDKTAINGQIYYGHDELSTGTLDTSQTNPTFAGTFMADDFGDAVSQAVTHVTWWGSYLPNSPAGITVPAFLVSFESNAIGTNPATGGTFSEPGTPLWTQIVSSGVIAPQSGTFTETPADPTAPDPLYKYNAELKFPFAEQAGTTYWLKIAALTGVNSAAPVQWGWHDRDWTQPDPLAVPAEVPVPGPAGIPLYHYEDDAVSGAFNLTVLNPADPVNGFVLKQSQMLPQNYIDNVDGPPGIGAFSKDLAFQLYYTPTPEPASIALAGAGALGLLSRRRRA